MASMRDEGRANSFFDDDKLSLPSGGNVIEYPSVEIQSQSDEQMNRLVKTIEGEIIPRLVLAHRTDHISPKDHVSDSFTPGEEEITALSKMVLTQDVSVAMSYVEAIHSKGTTLERIFLELLAPTARLLGDLWKEDLCTFSDVTIGLGRLQQILRELSRSFRKETDPWEQGRRALLVPAPCEQHNFGILMVAEFLRRAGWDVTCEPAIPSNAVAKIVRREWFALIGLSLSCDDGLEALAAEIRTARKVSRNGSLGVIVGGRVFVEHPEYTAQVGADAMAVDGRHAALQAESLHTLLVASC